LHLMGALAEIERSLIVERTRGNLIAAKPRGQKLGRKAILTPAQVKHARRLIDGGESPRTVASTLRVGRTTLWRAWKVAA
jgi:DNA invertase Pin-like site-specific DNA recombinase